MTASCPRRWSFSFNRNEFNGEDPTASVNMGGRLNYDQVAYFLLTSTTPGFRAHYLSSAQHSLGKCGFDPVESSQLRAARGYHPDGGYGYHT